MAGNFAHFSILDGEIKETVKWLKKLPKIHNPQVGYKFLTDIKNKNLTRTGIDRNRMETSFNRILGFLDDSVVYYVGQNNRWLTVWSENFRIEFIQSFASSISKKSNKLFLVIGYEYNEKFDFALLQNGVVLMERRDSSQRIINQFKYGTLEQAAEALGISEQIASLEDIFQIEDKKEKILALEKILDMKLWLDEVNSLPDDLEKVAVKN